MDLQGGTEEKSVSPDKRSLIGPPANSMIFSPKIWWNLLGVCWKLSLQVEVCHGVVDAGVVLVTRHTMPVKRQDRVNLKKQETNAAGFWREVILVPKVILRCGGLKVFFFGPKKRPQGRLVGGL